MAAWVACHLLGRVLSACMSQALHVGAGQCTRTPDVNKLHVAVVFDRREVYSGNRQVPVELPEAPAVVAGHLAYLANTGYPSMVGGVGV